MLTRLSNCLCVTICEIFLLTSKGRIIVFLLPTWLFTFWQLNIWKEITISIFMISLGIHNHNTTLSNQIDSCFCRNLIIKSCTYVCLFVVNSWIFFFRHLDVRLSNCSVYHTTNRETVVEIKESVRGKDVYIIQTGSK